MASAGPARSWFALALFFGIAMVMLGAIVTVHSKVGFFMNWTGKQAGEGFEYHLLVIGIAIALMIRGGGALSRTRGTAGREPAGVAARAGRTARGRW